MHIDYAKLGHSQSWYEFKGYANIEAPWWVTQDILNITKPDYVIATEYFLAKNNKCLVASGEQSFLYMANKGRLPEGQYQTVTPCFRDDAYSVTHRKFFMKNELIITKITDGEKQLEEMISYAKVFFSMYINHPEGEELLFVEKQEDYRDAISYDIVFKKGDHNIELGSYGIRSCEFLTWIYGTGCAEPRLSLCEKLFKDG